MRPKGVTLLGSTGSVGTSTLSVLQEHTEAFKIIALTASSNTEKMFEQCQTYLPRYAVMADRKSALVLRKKLKTANLPVTVLSGVKGLCAVASLPEVSIVVAGIVGVAGLLPSYEAVKKGKTILFANKETLVVAGEIFMRAAKKHGAKLLPIDSEHNAIFQCLPASYTGEMGRAGIRRILLTASGGPFRTVSQARFPHVTPKQACAHPKWKMGQKISVDSATLMNKGLEVIEAHILFQIPPEHIQVLVHPQSIIHSMVEYIDGSILAQLSSPDMRTPIAHALGYPQRLSVSVPVLDFFHTDPLSFEKPDFIKFPCLRLAYESLRQGWGARIVLNAANEIAVEGFLKEQIRFSDIPLVIEQALKHCSTQKITTLKDVLATNQKARTYTKQLLKKFSAT